MTDTILMPTVPAPTSLTTEATLTYHAGGFLIDMSLSGCILHMRATTEADYAMLKQAVSNALCSGTVMRDEYTESAQGLCNGSIHITGGDVLRTLVRLHQVNAAECGIAAALYGERLDGPHKQCLIEEKELWSIAGSLFDKPADELNKARLREGMDQLIGYYQTDKGREAMREAVDEDLIEKMMLETRRVMRLPADTPQETIAAMIEPQIELRATRRERESLYALQRYLRHLNDEKYEHSFHEACKWARNYKHLQPFIKFACKQACVEQDNTPLMQAVTTLPGSFLEDLGVMVALPTARKACA